MCNFFTPVSDHGKCGIKLRLSAVGVHYLLVSFSKELGYLSPVHMSLTNFGKI